MKNLDDTLREITLNIVKQLNETHSLTYNHSSATLMNSSQSNMNSLIQQNSNNSSENDLKQTQSILTINAM